MHICIHTCAYVYPLSTCGRKHSQSQNLQVYLGMNSSVYVRSGVTIKSQ